MSKYVYQIQGALESEDGVLRGLRVMVCDLYNFDSVDVPIAVLDKETRAYLKYRLMVTEAINIQQLPIRIQNNIRAPLGRWLDRWVLDNFHGDSSERKSINP